MLSSLLSLQAQRQRLLKKSVPGALQDFYQVAFPEPRSSITDITFAVLDVETTGLDMQNDQLLSIGVVDIQQLGVLLGSAEHTLVQSDKALPEITTVIHGITDDALEQGEVPQVALANLLSRLAGKVLIAHHASIELGQLNKLCQQFYQQDFLIPVIDTQTLAYRQLSRGGQTVKQGDLRLFNLRKRYGLPDYKAHHALYDAMATAELFLALVGELYPARDCQLKDLLEN